MLLLEFGDADRKADVIRVWEFCTADLDRIAAREALSVSHELWQQLQSQSPHHRYGRSIRIDYKQVCPDHISPSESLQHVSQSYQTIQMARLTCRFGNHFLWALRR
jgi:hypothetical protein